MSEDRQKVWDEYKKANPKLDLENQRVKILKRMYTTYDRYFEAKLLFDGTTGSRIVNIVDYGCGTGDYGMYFLKENKDYYIKFYDYSEMLEFVQFRLDREGLHAKGYKTSGLSNNFLFKNADLVIFGEVLEHLKNPLKVLESCHRDKVKFLFTTSYPYRDDSKYWDDREHLQPAKDQMEDCKKFLEDNYTYHEFAGRLRLWTRKI